MIGPCVEIEEALDLKVSGSQNLTVHFLAILPELIERIVVSVHERSVDIAEHSRNIFWLPFGFTQSNNDDGSLPVDLPNLRYQAILRVAHILCTSQALPVMGSWDASVKIFISCDMEGISGVTDRDDVDPTNDACKRFQKIMTGDVNAVEGGCQGRCSGE